MDVAEAVIDTLGVTDGFTKMLKAFEVALGDETQVSLEVNWHVTTSPD